MAQRPVAVSLLLCEQVIIEAGTRNVTPVNCFSRRYVEQIPSEPISFVVLAHLTDGIGEMHLELFITRLDTLDEIYREAFSTHLSSPLQELRCTFAIRNCSFPIAGQFQVQLVAAGEVVAQKKFFILRRKKAAS